MKKRIIALLCLLVMAVSMTAVGCQGKVVAFERGTPVTYYSTSWRGVDDDEFYISAFVGPQDFYAAQGYALPSLLTDETFAYLAECGINNIAETFFQVDSESAAKALQSAEQQWQGEARRGKAMAMKCVGKAGQGRDLLRHSIEMQWHSRAKPSATM